ncbi:hypothetical protein [Nitrosarchaeum koreense]|uniref:Uncharacterized protein n=1 Tax=Nitrosarchaeum koreense MY1 TaxID=1001994 RepID=F9CZ84_9ARCH|nr:hypothetical protein [Nitrosarchaeum koreense]EGP94242.1 hypothetical protein MY1_1487 [Nitrosarchaeum koreense MY1]
MQAIQNNQDFLRRYGYSDNIKVEKAIELLLINRRHELRTIAESVLNHIPGQIILSEWSEFILHMCLDVEECFSIWKGDVEPPQNFYLKSFIILKQFSKGKTSMNQLTQFLNLAYSIAQEFRVIYKRVE